MRKTVIQTITLVWVLGAGAQHLGSWGGGAWALRTVPPRGFRYRRLRIQTNFKGRVQLRYGSFHRLPYKGAIRLWGASSVRACFRYGRRLSCLTLALRPIVSNHFRCWAVRNKSVAKPRFFCLRVRRGSIGGRPIPHSALGRRLSPHSPNMTRPRAYSRMIHTRITRQLSLPGHWSKKKLMRCLGSVKLGITLNARGEFLWKQLRVQGVGMPKCLFAVIRSVFAAAPFPKPWPSSRKRAQLTIHKPGLTVATGRPGAP